MDEDNIESTVRTLNIKLTFESNQLFDQMIKSN